jgi:hypothetical protein
MGEGNLIAIASFSQYLKTIFGDNIKAVCVYFIGFS